MPRLSVLMPAYNAERTVAAAVRSTLRAMPDDAELVVLDDGSSDGTAEQVQRAADGAAGRRVRLIRRENGGVAAALNALIAATDSRFVARMDADDLVLPGRFRRQLSALEGGADAVFTTVVMWGAGGPRLPRPSGIDPDVFGFHLLLTNPVAHSTFLGRREALDAVGGYRALPTEDYDLWLRMAAKGARLCRLAVPGLAYRVHDGQVTASAEWRRASWFDPRIGEAYSRLGEQLLGAPVRRITTLSADPELSREQKRQAFDAFARRFTAAISGLDPESQRALSRKLAQREEWFAERIAAAGRPTAPPRARPAAEAGASPVPGATPRARFRNAVHADRAANAGYAKSRLILRWLRAAQRWRAGRGPLARVMHLVVGGGYKLATEWVLGCEIPASTRIGPGLRLRHAFGVVVNPATVIGANVMLRHGVTLGNRRYADDCPVIADDVEIGVGATVIGAITVGRGARIGPGAVVVSDVPPHAVVRSPEAELRVPHD